MSTSPKVRLTRTGTTVAVGAAMLAVLGLVSGYREFVVLAVAAAVAILIAFLLPRVRSQLTFRRENLPRFVQRGESLRVALAVDVERSTPPLRVFDQLSGSTVPIQLSKLSPAATTLAEYRVRALRRGAHQLGPILEARTDPFALASRTISHPVFDEVLVHPVIHRLDLPETAARAREARTALPRTSDDPLSEFRALREYVPGDDQRNIHWVSSAKTGTLLVRNHLEIRRGNETVLLETFDRSATDQLFEAAVEIAASLVCEAIRRDVVVTARTRDRRAPGRGGPLRHREDALELFSRVQRSTADVTVPASHVLGGRDPGDRVYLVAGAGSPLISQLCAAESLRGKLIIIRLVDGSAPVARLPVPNVDVTSAEDFVARWRKGLVPV